MRNAHNWSFRFAFGVSLAVLLTSCSKALDTNAAWLQGIADATSVVVPKPAALVLPPRRSQSLNNAADYNLFSSWEDAAAAVKNIEEIWAQNQQRAVRKILPHDSSLYAPAEAIVGNIRTAFEQYFPEDTTGVPVPYVVIIDEPQPNAMVLFKGGKVENLILVHSGMLSTLSSKEKVTGLFAHELAHHALKHFVKDVSQSLERTYFADKMYSTQAFLRANNEGAQALVSEYNALVKRSGGVTESWTMNFPVGSGSSLVENMKVQSVLIQKGALSGGLQCDKIMPTLAQALPVLNRFLLGATIRESEATSTRKTVASARDMLLECVDPVKQKYSEIAAEALGVPESMILAGLNEKGIEWNAGKPGVAFFEIVGVDKQRLREIDASTRSRQLRQYTAEDDADEVATIIGRALRFEKPVVANFLEALLLPEARETCRLQIASATGPEYGPLYDPHHSTCWRVGRAEHFHQELENVFSK
jgi:hypothetical protein